jgi:hypothetical protein
MSKSLSKSIRYEVRIPGDGEFDYFVESPGDEQEFIYDPTNVLDCKRHAKLVNGWVVKVTEEKI